MILIWQPTKASRGVIKRGFLAGLIAMTVTTFQWSNRAQASGGWERAIPAVFPVDMPAPPYVGINSVSCASPGNCTAVGWFGYPVESQEDSSSEAFTMSSINGVWERARPAVFASGVQSDSPDTDLTSVSCATAGNCTAVGQFRNSDGYMEAFTMTSTIGEWGLARPAVFASGIQSIYSNARFSSISCATAGNCTAAGWFANSRDDDEAFTMTSTAGVWQQARPAVFASGIQSGYPDTDFSSVSCATAGNCTAVGQFKNSEGFMEAFTMTSTIGEWGLARPAVFASGIQSIYPNARFSSISCATAGNCTAVGRFRNLTDFDEAFTATSTDGVWEKARPVVFANDIQSGSPDATFNSVSCATAGNCTGVGRFKNSDGYIEAFTMSMADGEWDLARRAGFNYDTQSPSPSDTLTSVSCASPGNCTAVGQFKNSTDAFEAFTLTSTNGMWDKAEPAVFPNGTQSDPGFAGFTSVSCASPRNCSAVGEFANSSNRAEAFAASLVNETPTPPDEGWEQARPAEFPNGLLGFSEIIVSSISCASSGNCTVVGGFQHIIYMHGFHAFTMTSTNGVWAPARASVFPNGVLPDTWAFTVLKSVSCATAGSCTAVGSFRNSAGSQEAFTMTSTNGVWADARPAEFADGIQSNTPGAEFTAVSCATAGHCTAIGSFRNSDDFSEAFTMTSTNGVWADARPAEFADEVQNENPDAILTSVSCPTARNCSVVGRFKNFNSSREAFTMSMADGEWDLARPAEFADGVQLNSPIAGFTSVSCATAGNCTAAGWFANSRDYDEAFTMTSTNGVWELARPAVFPIGVQNDDPNSSLNSVSCPTARNCVAVGKFRSSSGSQEAFTMTSTNGVWELARPAEFANGVQIENFNSILNSVTCPSARNCTAVGNFTNSAGFQAAFTMTSTNGVWELARPVVFPIGTQSNTPYHSLNSVSCPTATSCTAAGEFALPEVNSGAGAVFTMSSATPTPPASDTEVAPSADSGTSPIAATAPSPTTTISSTTTAVRTTSMAIKKLEKIPATGTNPLTMQYAIWALIAGFTLTYRRKLRQR